ncbi:YccF domain-containing protein [Bacillus sp. 1P06AnD]|uniref:YccF domain-containing protein n=1 Tax=Bacillus sp. 1P06AnD TaxID=3132208 RepID=UPI00399FCB3E
MGCIGNILWFIFGGFFNAVGWFFIGLIWCITVIGIPVGLQCFKMAKLQLAPFGKEVVTVDNGVGSLLLNILWLIFGGIPLAISNLVSAFFLAITIIGIPFALQALKMAQLSLMPFGKEVR